MVVHCYAGISRSTASAFAAACLLNPHRDEGSIARQIRAASPIASPNRLIVSLADKALGRDGRMLRALQVPSPVARAFGEGHGPQYPGVASAGMAEVDHDA